MLSTRHRVIHADSRLMAGTTPASIDLVVTSPPYPMVEMWDGLFTRLNGHVGRMLAEGSPWDAFELMHRELDAVWLKMYETLRDGGIACIVAGDATRSAGGTFALYPNHSRILSSCASIGFRPLPGILWRKESNKPNKFMGSGMLPPAAYPTLEHEHILVLRKGGKRKFELPLEKSSRRRSAYFWEERNQWFSDFWDGVKGERQSSRKGSPRERDASFPPEIARRLILMFSVYGDTVLDPFLGSGTTAAAAAICCRSSVGYEIESGFGRVINERLLNAPVEGAAYVNERLQRHLHYVQESSARGAVLRHRSRKYGFPVTTSQEVDIEIRSLSSMNRLQDGSFEALYR